MKKGLRVLYDTRRESPDSRAAPIVVPDKPFYGHWWPARKKLIYVYRQLASRQCSLTCSSTPKMHQNAPKCKPSLGIWKKCNQGGLGAVDGMGCSCAKNDRKNGEKSLEIEETYSCMQRPLSIHCHHYRTSYAPRPPVLDRHVSLPGPAGRGNWDMHLGFKNWTRKETTGYGWRVGFGGSWEYQYTSRKLWVWRF